MYGSRIRELRKKHKLTSKQLGEKLNVAESTISGYENETRKPDIDVFLKIADLFGESIDYITGRTDKRESSPQDYDSILNDPDIQFIARSKQEMTPQQFQRLMELARISKEMANKKEEDE